MTQACLHQRFKRRPKAADLVPQLEALCTKVPAEEVINPDFFCPITDDVMRDPVITSAGHSYERSAIEGNEKTSALRLAYNCMCVAGWLAMHNTDPKTNIVLESLALVPNHTLRSAIEGAPSP